MSKPANTTSIMNDTKWNELHLAMHALEPSPAWSTLDVNGYRCPPDRDWFYHFRTGGYATIEQVEIIVDTPEQRDQVRSLMQSIHLPGMETTRGFCIYGYQRDGQPMDYI